MNPLLEALKEICKRNKLNTNEVLKKHPELKQALGEDLDPINALLSFTMFQINENKALKEQNRKLQEELEALKKTKCLQRLKSKSKQNKN